MKFDVVFEEVMRSLNSRALATESVIGINSMSNYFILLMQGKDADAAEYLKKLIPFDEARVKFEQMAKDNYVDKHFNVAAKQAYAKRSRADMFNLLKRSGIVEKFIAYAKHLMQTVKDPEGAFFNGEPLEEIRDPKGGEVTYKFHTGMGSVYIMTNNQMSRRVKSEQGRGDTGLHDWHELIFFAKNDCSGDFSSAELRKIADAVMNGRLKDEALKQFGDISLTPKIDYFVFEIKNLAEQYLTYHPGHEVTRIDWARR